MHKSIYRLNQRKNGQSWLQQYNLSHDYYLSFDKVDDVVRIDPMDNINVFDPENANPMLSLFTWVYCKSNGESTLGTIFNKGHANNAGFQLHVYAGNASFVKVGTNIRHGDGSDGQQATNADGASNGSLPRNQWAFVGFTYNEDGDHKLKTYVNGSQISYSVHTAGVGALVDDTPYPLFIGNKLNGTVDWDGYIRNTMFFKGIALTASQISSLYTGIIPAGLTAHYPFYEGRGYVLHDVVGGAHGRIGKQTGTGGGLFTPGAGGATWGKL